MSYITILALVFAVLGAVDRIIGNRFGLGKEFERGFMLLGTMSLSMTGMIVIAPFLADVLQPVFDFFANVLKLDPSVIPASLFANDMGGAPLSKEVALNETVGGFNALVVSSMMGCTISFTIPYAMTVVEPERHKHVLFGFLCGIVTIPLGCFAAGLMCRIPIGMLLLDLLPLVIFSAVIAVGLVFCPALCIRIFGIIGTVIKAIITVGLILGVLSFLTGLEPLKGLATLEEGTIICLNASAVLCGMFPLMFVLSKILSKPMKALGRKLSISETSAMGLLSNIITNATVFEMVNRMDTKGIVLNSAFAVSAAFTFGGHLAFTMAFDTAYLAPVIVGKLIAGFAGLLLAVILYERVYKNKEATL